jgi:hypothetical protein
VRLGYRISVLFDFEEQVLLAQLDGTLDVLPVPGGTGGLSFDWVGWDKGRVRARVGAGWASLRYTGVVVARDRSRVLRGIREVLAVRAPQRSLLDP